MTNFGYYLGDFRLQSIEREIRWKSLGLLDYPGRVDRDSSVIITSSRKRFWANQLPLISPCTSPLLFRNSSHLSTSLTRGKHISSGIMGQAPGLKGFCLWTSSNIVPPEKRDYLSFLLIILIIIMMRMTIMIAMTIPMKWGSAPTKIETFCGIDFIVRCLVGIAMSVVGMFSLKLKEPMSRSIQLPY